MSPTAAWIDGVGVIGPGLVDWRQAVPLLSGREPWSGGSTDVPPVQALPPAERRRTGLTVRLALAAGLQAVAAAAADATRLPAVFTPSGGDGQNCHEICQALAQSQREISPTRFHNSVHNAAAGYWGIATGATPASNALCGYDGSFAVGLLEALVQCGSEDCALLLVAHDAPYPSPLREVRPIPDAFATALVLSPRRSASSLAHLAVSLTTEAATRMPGALEALRSTVPAARALPLLALLAQSRPGRVVLDYLDDLRIALEIQPCH